jgi:hypothetical protein
MRAPYCPNGSGQGAKLIRVAIVAGEQENTADEGVAEYIEVFGTQFGP